MILSFTIPGAPKSKARHRTAILKQCKKCGRKTVQRQCRCGSDDLTLLTTIELADKQTANYENLVAICAAAAMAEAKIGKLLAGPLTLDCTFYFPIAETRRCKKHQAGTDGWFHANSDSCKKLHENDFHSQRPDYDNCVKSIFDGLNTVLWGDDSQISEGTARKRWSMNPRTEVTVTWNG